MKALINAQLAALRTLSWVRDSDVYVTESLELVPDEVKFPAIAIKDGPIARSELAGGMWERTLTVRIGIFAQVLKPGATIMGDAPTSQKGLLDLALDVHGVLDENLLGIAGVQSAFSASESESEAVGGEEEMLQRKIITYTYTQEEIRP